VPGCSSGEEAYSLAIVLHECMKHHNRHFKVQIFGTDIDADAINIARSGLYPASIMADVSQERLNAFFFKEDGGCYKIRKSVREMLVFAPQSLIKDPPFTKLDMISCRNLFIYFGAELQKRLFPIFHYSLKPDGVLFLGSSESIGHSSELFSLLNKKWKLFRRKSASFAGHPALEFPPVRTLPVDERQPEKDVIKQAETLSVTKLIEAILDQSNTPPCVIIDDVCNIVYIHGHTGRYLEPPVGKASVNILGMARAGLKVELAAAIRKVRFYTHEEVLKNLSIKQSGGFIHVDVTVKPVLDNSGMRGLMMVVFRETGASTTEPTPQGEVKQALKKKQDNRTVDEVEQELHYTRENLQTTIEELETTNEELKSTNEELQSTNEELETSKEELQSLNEESITVNAELQSSIDELSKTTDDMKNLLDSTELATLFLDSNLCIRRFTPKATSIIPLAITDTGRPLKHFASTLLGIDLSNFSQQVLDDLDARIVEARNQEGTFYAIQVRPYRTVNNVVDGVVVTFDDITERKQLEEASKAAQEFAENIVDTVREPLIVLDQTLRVVTANRSFYRAFHVKSKETERQLIYELGNGQWDIPQLRKLLGELLPEKRTIEAFEITHSFHTIGQRTMLLNARQMISKGEGCILLAIEDVTDREGLKA